MKILINCQPSTPLLTSTLYSPITYPCTQLRTWFVPQLNFISESSVIKIFVARSNAPPPSAATRKQKTKNHSGRLMWDTAKGSSPRPNFNASKLAQFIWTCGRENCTSCKPVARIYRAMQRRRFYLHKLGLCCFNWRACGRCPRRVLVHVIAIRLYW